MADGSYHSSQSPSYTMEKSSYQCLGNTADDKDNYAYDPTASTKSSGFFASDCKKLDDLKEMLDSSKDSLKLEAMKKVIEVVACGQNCSELFPSVVKNVASKDLEVKKLVYVYLTRYAEQEQDLALLSVSTFQKALKDPNQLIRGSALRVLSSIRVSMLVPILMLGIRDAACDLSPYVRRAAAHAIPKLYNLDHEQKDALVEIIEKLLNDATPLVLAGAVQAFHEVCPERCDLLHKHFRKLCQWLLDVEEWGQVVILNLLTRYARCEFADPKQLPSGPSVIITNSSTETRNHKSTSKSHAEKVLDEDHRLLLQNSRPLLNSRNSAVVLAVAQLHFHCAPTEECAQVVKPLLRLLHSHSEVQMIVLTNIATLSVQHKAIFLPYVQRFFVHSSDTIHVKLLKLDILTNLASTTNIPHILKEFQSYVSCPDRQLAADTITAIGRCASLLPDVMDVCLSGLMNLMTRSDDTIVAESVVVVRKLLQMQRADHREVIVRMASLLDQVRVSTARASILWLVGEYAESIPKIAPDILRKSAKTFCQEEDTVKYQVLNLACKLYLVNPRQTCLLVQYVLNLAKYDQSYDVRDRARFLRALLLLTNPSSTSTDVPATPVVAVNGGDSPRVSEYLHRHAKTILLATKPAPNFQSEFQDRAEYQLGSLSHAVNHRVVGYEPLPEWPVVVPVEHRLLRDVQPPKSADKMTDNDLDGEPSSPHVEDLFPLSKMKRFGKGPQIEDSQEDEEDNESSGSGDTSESHESMLEDTRPEAPTASSSSASDDSTDTSDLESSDTSSDDMDGHEIFSLQPTKLSNSLPIPSITAVSRSTAQQHGHGLAVEYRFPRMATSGSGPTSMLTVELHLTNCLSASEDGDTTLHDIHILGHDPSSLVPFPHIPELSSGASSTEMMLVDFMDSVQQVKVRLQVSRVVSSSTVRHKHEVVFHLQPSVGELLRPLSMTVKEFIRLKGQLQGMTETHASAIWLPEAKMEHVEVPRHLQSIVERVANMVLVMDTAAVATSSSEEIPTVRLSGDTCHAHQVCLLEIQTQEEPPGYLCHVHIHCENIILGSQLCKEVTDALQRHG